MTAHPTSQLVFSARELDLLGRTADALSAYMGKPVLAEVIDARETGFEWVIFGVPLETADSEQDRVTVQIGGPKARLLGHKGGLAVRDGDAFSCEYLWAIQLSALEGVRFIKVDGQGEEIAWTENLDDVLPFVMSDDQSAPKDDDEDEDGDDDARTRSRT